MNRRLLPLLATTGLCALAIAPAGAAEPPGFKGAVLGSDLALIASDPRFDCRPLRTPIADRVCDLRHGEKETIAGMPVASLFYFYDGRALTGITMNLDEKHIQTVVDALTGKYGPSEIRTETVRNLNGASFENRTWRWRLPGGTIEAQRYAGRLDKSSIRVTDHGAAERIRQRRESTARDPRRDL